jgi:hypothetical protein
MPPIGENCWIPAWMVLLMSRANRRSRDTYCLKDRIESRQEGTRLPPAERIEVASHVCNAKRTTPTVNVLLDTFRGMSCTVIVTALVWVFRTGSF